MSISTTFVLDFFRLFADNDADDDDEDDDDDDDDDDEDDDEDESSLACFRLTGDSDTDSSANKLS